MRENDHFYSELDMELQKLSLIDWPTFVLVVGPENIEKAKICILRARGRSLNQISIKKNKTREAVRWACRKCPDVENKSHLSV